MRKLIIGLWLSALCSTVVGEALSPTDPWEGFNRKVDAFNQWADRVFLMPVAKGWRWVVPKHVDHGITNVFLNAQSLNEVINDLLQGKFGEAGIDSGRFLLNTTVGLLGFYDVAGYVGLRSEQEDFGQTLAVWGVPQGPYLVLPFLGPSTLRDALSRPFNAALDGVQFVDHERTLYTLRAAQLLDQRADLIDTESLITGDPYVFTRGAYLDRRNYLIRDGEIGNDDFGDDDFESWD